MYSRATSTCACAYLVPTTPAFAKLVGDFRIGCSAINAECTERYQFLDSCVDRGDLSVLATAKVQGGRWPLEDVALVL